MGQPAVTRAVSSRPLPLRLPAFPSSVRGARSVVGRVPLRFLLVASEPPTVRLSDPDWAHSGPKCTYKPLGNVPTIQILQMRY